MLILISKSAPLTVAVADQISLRHILVKMADINAATLIERYQNDGEWEGSTRDDPDECFR